MGNKLSERIASFPIFDGAEPRAAEDVTSRGTIYNFKDGESLMDEGKLGAEVYLILEGSVKVTLQDGTEKKLGPGTLVGERALVITNRRSASVVAAGPVEALTIHGSDFHQLLMDHPQLRERVEALAESRQ